MWPVGPTRPTPICPLPCVRFGLPLHVRRRIGATTFQRHDVVDDVAGAAVRIAGLAHELVPRLRAAGDVAAAVAGA